MNNAKSILVKDYAPQLRLQWDSVKNAGLEFDLQKIYSKKVAWWNCERKHSWSASIIHRAVRGDGCPYCSGRYAILGETDLETVNPLLSLEWDYEENEGLLPNMFLPFSNKKVGWRCAAEGHKWKARICDRSKGKGCPYCAGKLPIIGKTDFESQCRWLLPEWDYILNEKLPSEYTMYSSCKVFWKCERKHSWKTSIINRVVRNTKCPYCSGKLPIPGETDLATLFPEVARQWDYEKNPDAPESISAYSNKRRGWICSEEHRWEAVVYSRTYGKLGCPYCSGYKPIKGVNDLPTVNPDLSLEWNYKRNKLPPDEYAANSNKRVWWNCSYEHEWRASVDKRNNGTSCPICYGRRFK